LDSFVHGILGYPRSHSRYQPIRDELQNLYDAAIRTPECGDGELIFDASGQTNCGLNMQEHEALRFVWNAVCQLPEVTSMGL
ncbi:MAG: hypothetical protein AAFX99_22095, partial [Myxococcota bacterium]